MFRLFSVERVHFGAFVGLACRRSGYFFDWMIVKLAGGWRYNSATPGERHPTRSNTLPASVAFTGERALSAQLKLIFPFR